MTRATRALLLLSLAVAIPFAAAKAQSVGYTDLSGNECWNAGQSPGGPSQFLCSNVLRNSAAKVAAAVSGAATYGVSALETLRWGGNVLFTVQPVAVTALTLPANPVPDGAIVGFCNVTGSAFATTAISWTANTGQTLSTAVSIADLGANVCKYAQFNRANTTWYVIQ